VGGGQEWSRRWRLQEIGGWDDEVWTLAARLSPRTTPLPPLPPSQRVIKSRPGPCPPGNPPKCGQAAPQGAFERGRQSSPPGLPNVLQGPQSLNAKGGAPASRVVVGGSIRNSAGAGTAWPTRAEVVVDDGAGASSADEEGRKEEGGAGAGGEWGRGRVVGSQGGRGIFVGCVDVVVAPCRRTPARSLSRHPHDVHGVTRLERVVAAAEGHGAVVVVGVFIFVRAHTPFGGASGSGATAGQASLQLTPKASVDPPADPSEAEAK